jgi:hypothetical protein
MDLLAGDVEPIGQLDPPDLGGDRNSEGRHASD